MTETEIRFMTMSGLRKALRRCRMAIIGCQEKPGGLSPLLMQTLPDDVKKLQAEISRRKSQ